MFISQFGVFVKYDIDRLQAGLVDYCRWQGILADALGKNGVRHRMWGGGRGRVWVWNGGQPGSRAW